MFLSLRNVQKNDPVQRHFDWNWHYRFEQIWKMSPMKRSFPWKRRGVPDTDHSYFISLLINFLTTNVPFFSSRLSHVYIYIPFLLPSSFLPKTRFEKSIIPGRIFVLVNLQSKHILRRMLSRSDKAKIY